MIYSNDYDARSIVTLVFFVISVCFILFPVRVWRTRLVLNLSTVPPLCVLILLASTCIPISVVWDGIKGTDGIKPFNILILFFGLAYMSISVDLTGVLQAAAFWVSNRGGKSGFLLYTYFYLMSVVLAIILGNDPVILSGTAFLTYFTKIAEVDPLSFLIAEFAGCNLGSMVLFVGNPTNVVLCEGFSLGYLEFSAWTILPFLFTATAVYITLLVLFRNKVPKVIIAPELIPRAVLVDPFGAAVGSVMIIVCLITIIGVSFVGVEVWEIALPFAIAKAAFDLGWDFYRYKTGKLPEVSEKSEMATPRLPGEAQSTLQKWRRTMSVSYQNLCRTSPTFFTAFARLPFPLLSFTFSQFMLVEALVYHGWTVTFAGWLSKLTVNVPATIFSVGLISIVLCAFAGTNILSTILLTRIIRQYSVPLDSMNLRAASIALAFGSNIGAISIVFSASLAGLLWRTILAQKAIHMTTKTFATWNVPILLVASAIGFLVIYGEIEVYFRYIMGAKTI